MTARKLLWTSEYPYPRPPAPRYENDVHDGNGENEEKNEKSYEENEKNDVNDDVKGEERCGNGGKSGWDGRI